MSDFYKDAGELCERVALLEIVEVEPSVWTWVILRSTWTAAEIGTERTIFSNLGMGAKSVKLILRVQDLMLHHALLWRGRHLFISSIVPKGKAFLEVTAAQVALVSCLVERSKTECGAGGKPEAVSMASLQFSAVLTEKYVGYEQEESHAQRSVTYVLVTPKVIALREGELVHVERGDAAGVYHIQKCHRLDAYKNEYEIRQEGDV